MKRAKIVIKDTEEELLKLLESLPGMTFIYFKNISTDFIQ